MIQLIELLPFAKETFAELKKDWQRFQEGKVILTQIPDAICGEFTCEAEIQKPEPESETETDESDNETGSESDQGTSELNALLETLPSGKGDLLLTASKLYWITSSGNSGWSVDYKNVLLHAISKPTAARPYIYLQLSCNKFINLQQQEIKLSEEDEDEMFVEVRLYVDDEKVVDDIFVSLSECASLHPYDDDSGSEIAESESEDQHCDKQSKRNKIDLGRFEDAAEK